MKKNYNQIADNLIKLLGGKSNILKVFHCMTRLRFYVKNRKLVQENEIKMIKEVSGTNWHKDQFQVIIGNEVNAVYDAILDKGIQSDDDSISIPSSNKGIFSKIVEAITGCMTPMIPALTAAGMVKVVLSLLTTFKLVETDSSTYQVISFVGDVAFYFMPFLIAANAAKVFKVNQSLALIVAGIFLHPNFTQMMSSDTPVTIFSIPITKMFYPYSVIPVIMMVWIMSYIIKFVDKITPKMVKLILHPTLVILFSAPIALIIVGPLGGIIGNWLAIAIDFLSAKLGFIIVGILGATFPFIVMTGMHHALTPIGLNAIATGGTDNLIFVSQVCSNIAQGGSSLAVGLKSKNKDMKQLATASGISAIMGITEPALYGVTLKLKRPVIAASIAAGIGGIVGGILQVSLYIASNNILAIPAFIGDKGISNLIYGIIMILVSFFAAFILTLIFGFKDEENPKNEIELKEEKVEKSNLIEKIQILSPLSGIVKNLEEVPDKTFSEKVLGDGVAIVPNDNKIYAPADGTVISIMDTKHGLIFKTTNGVELLIHIGLDTVNLKGKYFKTYVENNKEVKAGDLLIEFDIEQIKKEGYNLITPIIIANINDYIKAIPMIEENSNIKHNELLLTIV